MREQLPLKSTELTFAIERRLWIAPCCHSSTD
jgi:hypothetical protein